MVTELAVLNVIPGREAEFEAAFAEVKGLIAAAQGFRSLDLQRCLENRSRYFFRVEWERLEDHTVGFRNSPAYGEWKTLLHHFYDPFPTVEHFELVARVESP